MVRDLHADGPRGRTATAEPEDEAPARDSARDLDPEELVLKDDKKRDKPKRPRNRKHGRTR